MFGKNVKTLLKYPDSRNKANTIIIKSVSPAMYTPCSLSEGVTHLGADDGVHFFERRVGIYIIKVRKLVAIAGRSGREL